MMNRIFFHCSLLLAIAVVTVAMGACEPVAGSTPSDMSSSSSGASSGEGGMTGCLASSSGSTASSANSSSSGGGGSGGMNPFCGKFATITDQTDVDVTYASCDFLEGIYVHVSNAPLTIYLPNLKSISMYIYLYDTPKLKEVSLPMLTSIGTNLYVDMNAELVSFDAPKLTSVGEYVYVVGNPNLNSFNVPLLFELPSNIRVGINQKMGADYTYILDNPAFCLQHGVDQWKEITNGSVTILNNKTGCCP
jgi:hypothetical protein